jgi:hypothetical protein
MDVEYVLMFRIKRTQILVEDHLVIIDQIEVLVVKIDQKCLVHGKELNVNI